MRPLRWPLSCPLNSKVWRWSLLIGLTAAPDLSSSLTSPSQAQCWQISVIVREWVYSSTMYIHIVGTYMQAWLHAWYAIPTVLWESVHGFLCQATVQKCSFPLELGFWSYFWYLQVVYVEQTWEYYSSPLPFDYAEWIALSASATCPASAPGDYTQHSVGGHFYKPYTTHMRWIDAIATCSNENATLSTLKNDQEMEDSRAAGRKLKLFLQRTSKV